MTDPRPQVHMSEEPVVVGVRCLSCGHPMATPRPRCAACGGQVEQADFGPAGTVYASTVVRITVGDRTPPYALAYVDLDEGPRILAHVAGDEVGAPAVESRVRLTAPRDGDVFVEVVT